jgi:hypothetical protein
VIDRSDVQSFEGSRQHKFEQGSEQLRSSSLMVVVVVDTISMGNQESSLISHGYGSLNRWVDISIHVGQHFYVRST